MSRRTDTASDRWESGVKLSLAVVKAWSFLWARSRRCAYSPAGETGRPNAYLSSDQLPDHQSVLTSYRPISLHGMQTLD